MPIRKGKRLLRIVEKARKNLEQQRRRTRERVSTLQKEEAITRKSEAEEKVWRDFDELKSKRAEEKAATIGQDIEDLPTVNETIQVFLKENPKNKLSRTEMISGLTKKTKYDKATGKFIPLVNIKTLDIDLDGIKKLAENLARKKNPNFNKLNRDKQIEIYRTMLAQHGTLLNRAKLFKDENRLKAFQASPTRRTREEFYESEGGKEFSPDPDAIKTPRPRYIGGAESVDDKMFPKTIRRADSLVAKKDLSQKIPAPTKEVRDEEIKKILTARGLGRVPKEGRRPLGTKRYPVKEQTTSKYDEATGEFIEPPIRLDPKTGKPVMGLSEKEKRIEELEQLLIDKSVSDEDIIRKYGDIIPYITKIEDRLVNPRTGKVIKDLGSIPNIRKSRLKKLEDNLLGRIRLKTPVDLDPSIRIKPAPKTLPIGRRITQEIDRDALSAGIRQNFRGLPKVDQDIPVLKKPEPFLETIRSPYRDPQTGKEIFPSQYDDPRGAELISSGRVDEGLLGSKNPYTDKEVISESLDLRKNSDRLRGKEISDDIPPDQVIKLQQTNLVEVQGNKLVWTKTADTYNKKVLRRDHKIYIDGLIKKGFARKVKDKKTGKTKVVYTSSFDDYLRRQAVTQRGESSPGQAEGAYRIPREDKYSKGGSISINEAGNLNPSELEEFLIKQGYKVNRKHGGQIKTKSRPKPKILQGGKFSNRKRPVGVGAAKCGYGAVRIV